MVFFLFSVASTIVLMLILKLFARFGVQTFPAIVVNYWVCVLVGALVSGRQPFSIDVLHAPWFLMAAILGSFFIIGFYAVGMTLQKFSLAIASIMQKMSLLISMPFGILIFSDSFSFWQTIGLVAAFGAIILTNIKFAEKAATHEIYEDINTPQTPTTSASITAFDWIFPILSLLCSGAIESGLRYTEQEILKGDAQASATFTLVSFGLAGIVGTLFLAIQMYRGRQSLQIRDVLGGIILGVPNYFSIFFLIMAFSWQDKSVILPIYSVTIIGISVFLGYSFFKEYLNRLNLLGVGLAIVAILLISLA
jgi:drug/metabolite transporter (DMT)-like permease